MTDTDYQPIADRLSALRAQIPSLIEQYPGDAFWDAYAGIADPILDDAGRISDDAHDNAYLYLNSVLFQHGLISADEIQT
ncbi:hypothetical protein ACI2IY_12675 [Lysobacter enzymogenes]|uniref:hypothetical protein n=1 Tax=Lysobacter enzymogenes TaxID=69 RepID=UPI00384FF7EE